MIRPVVLLCLGTVACGAPLADEHRGDAAAAVGRWEDALTAWQAAGDEPRVLAKRADGALHLARFNLAAAEFGRLGRRDTSRIGEAAAGLARTAIAAAAADDELALARAVGTLNEIAPGWPSGRLAAPLRLARFPAGEDVIRLAPAVLAATAASDAAAETLLAWARAEHEAGDCAAALGLYRAAERRSGQTSPRGAAEGYAACSTRLAVDLLERGELPAAQRGFEAAIRRDPEGAAGRRALVGLGDVLFQEGDLMQAQIAWRTAASTAGQSDSITTLALERLRASEVVDSAEPSGVP